MGGLRIAEARRWAASLASVFVAGMLLRVARWDRARVSESIFFGVLIAVPVVAALSIWSRRLAAQLLARGAWWSLLLLGGLMTLSGDTEVSHPGCAFALCSAGALLAAGRLGLGEDAGRFQPVAFRGTLLVALVLAMADTGSFLWFGMGNLLFEGRPSVLLMVPPMAAGVIGLLRLRTWGLLVSLGSNLLVAVLALARVLYLPGPSRALFVGTAILQLIVPIPMLVAIVRGRAPGPDRWPRAKRAVWTAAIVGLAGFSVYGAYIHHGMLDRM